MAGIFQILAQKFPVRGKKIQKDKRESFGEKKKCRKSPEYNRERKQGKMEKEDFLLSQIDEFREKAKQLQSLIALKESKAQELQVIVDEREDKAQELEQILTERQAEADELVIHFGKKVDELTDRFSTKMTEMESAISEQVAEVKKSSEEQLEANRKLNEEQVSLNKKLTEDQVAEVKALLENTTGQLESMKTDLSEKVHSENVKCYRNIQDLFNDFDSRIEKMDDMEKDVAQVKGFAKVLTWFSILNFVLLVGLVLYLLGVVHF